MGSVAAWALTDSRVKVAPPRSTTVGAWAACADSWCEDDPRRASTTPTITTAATAAVISQVALPPISTRCSEGDGYAAAAGRSQSSPLPPFRNPSAVSARAAERRRRVRSLRGERRPLSRAVGTGEFYAARDQRTSVRASRVCLCVTAEQAPTIFSMGAGHSPRACGGSPGLRHAGREVWLARLPDPFQGELVTPCRDIHTTTPLESA